MESKTILYSFLICCLALVSFALLWIFKVNFIITAIIESFVVFFSFLFFAKTDKSNFRTKSLIFSFFYLLIKGTIINYNDFNYLNFLYFLIFGFIFISTTIEGFKIKDGMAWFLWLILGMCINICIYLLSNFI